MKYSYIFRISVPQAFDVHMKNRRYAYSQWDQQAYTSLIVFAGSESKLP